MLDFRYAEEALNPWKLSDATEISFNVVAKIVRRQNWTMNELNELVGDCHRRCLSWSVPSGQVPVPVRDLTVNGPERWTLGFVFMLSRDSNFRCFRAFNLRLEHPDIIDLDSLFLEVTNDLIATGLLIESCHRKLMIRTG